MTLFRAVNIALIVLSLAVLVGLSLGCSGSRVFIPLGCP